MENRRPDVKKQRQETPRIDDISLNLCRLVDKLHHCVKLRQENKFVSLGVLLGAKD